MDDQDAVKGTAKVSGYDVLAPTPRQVGVARAYVDGLERDRNKLHEMEQNVNETIWEMIQLSAYSRALYLALNDLVRREPVQRFVDEEVRDRIQDLLDADFRIYDAVWSCECGHSKYDHDENGCMYLGCNPICGKS